MYIQLTTRCNMNCGHCGFACTNRGIDMSMATFRAALERAREFGEYITLGGGEPTVHPRFEQMLLEAIASGDEDRNVHIITNGKHKRRALMIARLIHNGVIDGELSQDEWHEEIDTEVVDAFGDNHVRNVGSHGRQPILIGRAVKHYGGSHHHFFPNKHRDCVCDSVFVTPRGVIKQCGCPRSPVIGHVDTGYYTPVSECCYRSEEYKQAVREAAA